jgi:hypothetical protein
MSDDDESTFGFLQVGIFMLAKRSPTLFIETVLINKLMEEGVRLHRVQRVRLHAIHPPRGPSWAASTGSTLVAPAGQPTPEEWSRIAPTIHPRLLPPMPPQEAMADIGEPFLEDPGRYDASMPDPSDLGAMVRWLEERRRRRLRGE